MNDDMESEDNNVNAKPNINTLQDLPDSPADAEKLKPETVIMDLPEVKDIPGQEHVKVLPMGELADTTISSDDEEGVGILDFDEQDDDDLTSDTSVNVTRQEKDLLDEAGTAIPDDQQLKMAELDAEDDDSEPLNEGSLGSIHSAADLDVPGAEIDDANEKIGEEDEENNDYSLGDLEQA